MLNFSLIEFRYHFIVSKIYKFVTAVSYPRRSFSDKFSIAEYTLFTSMNKQYLESIISFQQSINFRVYIIVRRKIDTQENEWSFRIFIDVGI